MQGISSTQFVVAVASGKGGVGKSTVTVNLAAAAAEAGFKVGLLDADIYGPSQSRMMGFADDVRPDVIDEKLLVPLEAHGIKSCLLYTSPSPRDKRQSRMPSSA